MATSAQLPVHSRAAVDATALCVDGPDPLGKHLVLALTLVLWISTPGRLLNFTAVALNFSPYFAIFLGPAFATNHPELLARGVN